MKFANIGLGRYSYPCFTICKAAAFDVPPIDRNILCGFQPKPFTLTLIKVRTISPSHPLPMILKRMFNKLQHYVTKIVVFICLFPFIYYVVRFYLLGCSGDLSVFISSLLNTDCGFCGLIRHPHNKLL